MATENVHLKITADSKNASKDVDKLSKGTKQAATETTLLGMAMGKVKTAMLAVKTTSKLLFGSIKAGLISTGIGAFLVVVGSLISYFKNTKKGAELLERAMAGIGAVVSVLTDRFSKVGEVVVKAFKDPKKAIADLWKALKENLVNRVTGMIDQFKALGKVIKSVLNMDWDGVTEGAKEYGQAIVQVTTGLDVEQQNKFANSIKGVVKELNNEAAAAIQLKQAFQDVTDSNRELRVQTAQSKAEIEGWKLIAEDITKGDEERLHAATQAFDIEQAQMKRRVENAEEFLRIKKAEVEMGESLAEDFDEIADLEIELAAIKEESSGKQVGLQNFLNSLKAASAAKDEALKDEELARLEKIAAATQVLIDKEKDRVKALSENSAKLLDDFKTSQLDIEAQEEQAINRKYEMVIEGRRALGEDVSALEEAQQSEITASHDKHAKLQVKIAQVKTKAEQDLVNQQLGAIAGALGAASALAGEGTEDWKALKSAEAVIGTATGAMQAYNSTVGIPVVGPVLAPIAAALAVVTGMKQLQAIQATEIPKPEGKARGGFIQGYGSGISDSIPARLSRGEVVINAKSSKAFRPLLSNINVAGGGIGFARGGATSPDVGRALDLMDPVAPKAFVLTDEMTNSQSRLSKIRRKASI